MTPFKLTGPKTIHLSAQEVALVLDSLSQRPFNQVAELIPKIIGQVRDQEMSPMPPPPSPVPELVEG